MLEQTIEQLKKDEGFRSRVYLDSRGFGTIGFGCHEITEEQASHLLVEQLSDCCVALAKQIPVYRHLDDVRASALQQMCFNLGIHGLLEFRNMLDCLEKKDWKGAADAMRNSLWAREVGNRAERLALMVETGKWLQSN